MAVTIHPSAIVEKGAELADGVEIGPFCIVSGKARLAENVRLVSHVSIAGSTTVGALAMTGRTASVALAVKR